MPFTFEVKFVENAYVFVGFKSEGSPKDVGWEDLGVEYLVGCVLFE